MAAGSAVLNIKILTDAKQAQAGLDKTASKAGKMGKGIQSAAAPAAAALLGVGAAAVMMGRAAAEDAQSQALLATALKNATGATDAQVAATEEAIGAMSAATGVADDQLRPAMATLVRSTGDVETSQKALAAALDISAATGKDVESVSSALAKGYAGNTSALGRLVPGIDKAILKTGDMDKIMAELARTTGGSAAAAADTAAGKMQKMQVAMDEAQESIGTALLPVMASLGDTLNRVATFAQEHPDLFRAIMVAVAALAAVIVILNIAMTIYTAITTAAAVVTWAWLWPIGLIILALLAIVAVIILLWTKCEWFRKGNIKLWNTIKMAASVVAAWVQMAWDRTFRAIATAVAWVRAKFAQASALIQLGWSRVATFVQSAWQRVFNAIVGAVNTVRARFAQAWALIQLGVTRTTTAVRTAWERVFSALRGAVSSIASVLSRPFNAVKGAIDSVIGAVQNLISWLGRIRIPKISLPSIPGFNATTTVAAPVGAAAARGLAAPRGAPRVAAGAGPTIIIQGAVDPESTARQIRALLAGHDRRMGRTGSGLRPTGTV